MSNPTTPEFEQLRRRFDGSDQFMRGCSIGGNPRSGNKIRAMKPPQWAVNDRLLQQVLLRAFPKLHSNKTQERRALLWLEVIYNFYRCGLPANQIALELFSVYGLRKRPWLRLSTNPEKYVENTIRRITKVAAGLRTTGKPRTNTRGRPKIIRL